MKKLNRKQYIIIFSGIIVLFVGILFYISFPYTKWLLSQYSLKLESLADANPNRQEALLRYLEANLLDKREHLSLKIGKIYDDAGKSELAEKYFADVRSDKYLDELTVHYLKTGDLEKAKAIVQKTNDQYYNALLTFIYNPAEAMKKVENTNNEHTKELKEYIQTIKDNPQPEYTDTAIALYLYNNGYNKLALIKLEPYKDSSYKDAIDLLGDIYFSQYQYKEASDAYEKSIALDSYNIEIYKKLSSAYEKLGDYDKFKITQEKIKSLSIIDKK